MLFNSYPFIFIFLPLVTFIFFQISRYSNIFASAWLVSASLFFYGWWNPNYLILLLSSIIVNYSLGVWLIRVLRNSGKCTKSKSILIIGLVFDLSLLGYYKYTNFFINNLNVLTGLDWKVNNIILPLGISFFTFTQIAFLVDAYRGEVKGYNFIHYLLFITYFPHLIAGPIIHHKEMIPQFENSNTYKFNYQNLAVGLTVFFMGLFKKTVLADGIAPHAVVVYSIADSGQILTFLEAWLGAFCYAFQLYFDFSGYSDMAIGCSLFLGIRLPLNFHSPYKSVNIIEFWRRWHMTLSQFLRDYLYIPLGGNRYGIIWQYVNLLITMTLGGVWHGAGWNYLLWGVLHGMFLTVNHLWQNIRISMGHDLKHSTAIGRLLGCILTVFAFVFSLALFRTKDLNSAEIMVEGMLALNGVSLPLEWKNQLGILESYLTFLGLTFQKLNARVTDTGFSSDAFKWLIYLALIIWLLPNSQQIMQKYFPAIAPYKGEVNYTNMLLWRPNLLWSLLTSIITIIGVVNITKVSEFLYYQF